MANLLDGGRIIIGVERTQNGAYQMTGVENTHLTAFDPDMIQAHVNRFADPYVSLEISVWTSNNLPFVEIRVREFEIVPVVCRADTEGLRAGAVYIRSTRMPETAEVRSQTEMREILELGINKGVRQFLARVSSVGISVEEVAAMSHKQRFANQRGTL